VINEHENESGSGGSTSELESEDLSDYGDEERKQPAAKKV